jgi:Transposase, Mutator family
MLLRLPTGLEHLLAGKGQTGIAATCDLLNALCRQSRGGHRRNVLLVFACLKHHLASTVGTELSHETISKITDQVAEEVLAWQRRPLEALYPVIYLDALVVKVKDAAHRQLPGC